jgi:hypothetical protein
MDSILRGQPAAEIGALLGALRQAGQPTMAVVAPAFPATGRTTVSGACGSRERRSRHPRCGRASIPIGTLIYAPYWPPQACRHVFSTSVLFGVMRRRPSCRPGGRSGSGCLRRGGTR